jgi:RNA polymerase sigma-70 factor (ECF subfamily)
VEFFTFDKAYLDRLREGDPWTEQHFVAYFEKLLRLKLRALMLSPDQVEDLWQETFIRVIANLRKGSIRQPERFGAFVNSICNRVLQEFYRSSAKNRPRKEAPKDMPDKAVELEGMLITKQSAEQVHRIIDAMPKRDRELLRAIFMEEKEKDTVCREFGVDREHLRVLTHRAKDKFKALYEKGQMEVAHETQVPNVEQAPSAEQVSSTPQVPGPQPVVDAREIPNARQIPNTERGSISERDSSAEQVPCANPQEPIHTATPPGAVLYSMAESICSKRTMEEIVTPLLADMQFEHSAAFSDGQKWEAGWIRVRGCWSLFTALGINRIVGLFVRIFLRFSSR